MGRTEFRPQDYKRALALDWRSLEKLLNSTFIGWQGEVLFGIARCRDRARNFLWKKKKEDLTQPTLLEMAGFQLTPEELSAEQKKAVGMLS